MKRKIPSSLTEFGSWKLRLNALSCSIMLEALDEKFINANANFASEIDANHVASIDKLFTSSPATVISSLSVGRMANSQKQIPAIALFHSAL